MHPVGYLFEDIYRNYWGITPAAARDRKGTFRVRVLQPFGTGRRR